MTPDQIRQIAEEYAKYVNSAYLSDKAEKEALRVVKWLTARFCVVERSKVVEAMKYPQRHCDLHQGELPIQALGVRIVLTDLFGSETFNKKEE